MKNLLPAAVAAALLALLLTPLVLHFGQKRHDVLAPAELAIPGLEGGTPPPLGTVYALTAAAVIEHELNGVTGWRPNDLFLWGPGLWADNNSNRQLGILQGMRESIRVFKDHLTKVSSDVYDPNLLAADNLLRNDPYKWAFPSAESRYREATVKLDAYIAGLLTDPPTSRPVNTRNMELLRLFQAWSDILGDAHAALYAPSMDWFKVDDVYYHAQGYAHVIAIMAPALALATLLLRLLGPLQGLSNVRVDVMTALVSFERVFEVLDLPSMIAERPDATPLPPSAARLEFDHVGFTYPRADEISLASLEAVARTESRDTGPVLTDVSFRAEPGEMVALVGPSGAGKTTVTHLVARLYDVTTGVVRVGGHDVRDLTLQSLEDAVGYVTQDAHLYHDTIRANLLYARPGADDSQIWAALEAAQISPLVSSLPDGLDTVVGDRGYRLSGGQRQRLAIARLLLKAPSIVVLDEATAHLDSESEVAVQRALDAALAGRTSLVIAHRLSTVREADRILVLDDGRIVQSGTHAELLAEGGLYADLYATQFRGATDVSV